MSSTSTRLKGLALATLILTAAPAAAQFNCLPSCAADDSRLLAVSAGASFQTLSDPVLDLTFTVPAGTASFQVGIFDGDAIGGVLAPVPDLHWDTGNPGTLPVFEYVLFADPSASVSGTQVVAGPFIGASFNNPANQLPDNDWFDFTVTTGPEAQTATGDYVYRLHIELMNPTTATVLNGFKVRTARTTASTTLSWL